MAEKIFDLAAMLEETSKKIEVDTIRLAGRKDGYDDVVNFIRTNNLKITQEVPDEEATPAEEVKDSKTK